METVRALWAAHEQRGLDAALEVAGDDVIWQPYTAGGRILRGAAELREAFAELAARGVEYEARLYDLEQHGTAVIAGGALRIHWPEGVEEQELEWVFHFREGRLWRQSSHASREDALAALAALEAITAPLGIGEEHVDGEQVVRLRGELDIAGAPVLERVLLRPRTPGEHVVVDLAALRFMDSTGLRVLLRAQDAAREGHWHLELRAVPAHVRRLFAMTGLEGVLPPETG
jgi:anti-anti-sigma factor